ncbi:MULTISPECIES: YbaN family protein [unclassified Mammaliicoccus]|uniref:YbaN family protein n=1 Tax=unclassified Mammaliicoccus TaxID=2803851 RepID=UPI001EFBFF04|nr:MULTISPECIES: YbaN family protein [unclassified Mammaliicoccus]
MKYVLISVGTIATVLGFIGAVMPLLPTTPFILLAVFCFAKSSDRFHKWLVSTKVYKEYVEDFQKYKGYTLKKKFELLISVYIVVGFSIWMIDHLYIRISLCIMLFFQTVVLFTFVKTLPAKNK